VYFITGTWPGSTHQLPAELPDDIALAPMSDSTRPQKRTSNTCVTCRARKVRCDGRQGICANCERLGFGCSYDESVGVEVVGPGESNGSTAISVPRRRVRQACQTCHARKARCSGSLPSCDRCRAQGLECVYRPGKRSLPMPNLAQATSPPSGVAPMDVDSQAGQNASNDYGTSGMTASPRAAGLSEYPQVDLDEALVLKAFDNFFRHVHHIAVFSFLHRPSLMERYHAGSLDRALVLSIVGIASLLTDLGANMVTYGNRCIDEAISMCLGALEKPTIARLQALVLATKHRILSKRFSSAFMLHAITSRFATALRLPHENPDLCFLARESRRRVMWSIYMIDASISTGQPEVALWPSPDRQIHVQLPCNERNFDFDLPEPTEPLRSPGPDASGVVPPLPDVLGLMALHIRLYWLRTRISECISRATASRSPETLTVLPGQLAAFVAELDLFDARLPASFRENEANFRLRSYSQRLGIFVMTHLLRRQCYLDLHRIFLPGLRESLPQTVLDSMDPLFVMHKRHSCYEHARAMADMFSQLLSLSNNKPPVADLELPGCAFQCVRVLYHGLQTDNAALGFTRERIEELANVCLRAARLSTPGSASASIVSFFFSSFGTTVLRPKDISYSPLDSKPISNGSYPMACPCPRCHRRLKLPPCRFFPQHSP
jgi:poly [ADP-ribose] polymerase